MTSEKIRYTRHTCSWVSIAPFGTHRRAGREEDVADVVALHHGGPRRAGGVVDVGGSPEEVVEADGAVGDRPAQHDDLLERVDSPVVAHRTDVVAVEKVGDGEQQADTRRAASRHAPLGL